MGVIGFAVTEGVAGTLNPNPVDAAGAVCKESIVRTKIS
jgi:hypothetical protein